MLIYYSNIILIFTVRFETVTNNINSVIELINKHYQVKFNKVSNHLKVEREFFSNELGSSSPSVLREKIKQNIKKEVSGSRYFHKANNVYYKLLNLNPYI